jgi:hypothetical protein
MRGFSNAQIRKSALQFMVRGGNVARLSDIAEISRRHHPSPSFPLPVEVLCTKKGIATVPVADSGVSPESSGAPGSVVTDPHAPRPVGGTPTGAGETPAIPFFVQSPVEGRGKPEVPAVLITPSSVPSFDFGCAFL